MRAEINYETIITRTMNPNLEFPYHFIDKILISREEIEERVHLLGDQITQDYAESDKLLLLGLLRGSVVFITDLMRTVRRPMTMDFMSVSSYSGDQSSGWVRIDSDHKTSIADWDVILIDDIVDTGITLFTVKKLLLERHPRSLRTCALLDKPDRHRIDIPIDYLGFSIPDHFVVGYGLDIDEHGRNLPYIASVDLEKYQKSR